jgi:hypothetical protein
MHTILKTTAAIIALLAATGQAQAVTVIGATKIVVTNSVPTWLQIGELQAIQFGTGTNVALASNGGTATASSQYAPVSGASKAIDGSINTNYFTTPGIYHSGTASAGEFLQINLAAATDLASLTIYGRSDGGNGARDKFNVSIFNSANTLIYSGGLDASGLNGLPVAVTFDAPPVGPVPEPATWLTMLAGFGAMGFTMRRKPSETVRIRYA